MSFSFVDRIVELAPAKRARGLLLLSDHEPVISPFLLSEAIGQLAAWVAMSEHGFECRPVAGLAGLVAQHADPPKGSEIELEVEIESLDRTAVAYRGRATAAGRPLVHLERCLGPMLPAADFDDPDRLRARFDGLCDANGSPSPERDREEVACPRVRLLEGDEGELVVPEDAGWRADHFPRRPVLPGTLLLESEVRFAAALAGRTLGTGDLRGQWVRNVKVRSFLVPGDVVRLTGQLVSARDGEAEARVEVHTGGKRIGAARIGLATPDPA